MMGMLKLNKNKDRITLFFMSFPAMVLLVIFTYGPVYGWVYAFYNYHIGMLLQNCKFVGLDNFKAAFTDITLPSVLVNTLALSLLSLLSLPISAIFAILLSELRFKRYGRLLQTVTTLPNFMSWIIVFSIFSMFFSHDDGVVNIILTNAHIIKTPLDPLGNVDFAWFFQTIIKMWKELGYGSIIFFAAIAGIDQELYDAAEVDGAGRFRKILHITVPGLVPTFAMLLLLSIGSLLSNSFDQIYVFMNGLVMPKLNVLDYYVFKIGLQNDDIPFATAVSISKTFISVALVFGANYLTKKIRGQSLF